MAVFWKPGKVEPGSDVDRASLKGDEYAGSFSASVQGSQAFASLSIKEQKLRLPSYQHRSQILYAVEEYPVLVLVGHTGSGKTTQIPQYLYEAGWGAGGRVIGCTQPRRVAVTTVASRVAAEMGVKLGEEVGYSIQFEDVSDRDVTRIKYLTDGMLFREMYMDPLLSMYSVIMIDEAHERTIYTDGLLGLLKKIRRKRPELRIIVSSATIDADLFADFFNRDAPDTAAIMSIRGKMFPVDIHFLKEPCQDYLQKAIDTVMDIHIKEEIGDVLVFLTGQEEIERAVLQLKEFSRALKRGLRLAVYPLYGGLPAEQQFKVFEPTPRGCRKVVCATNVAEASVTIDGVVYVVDAGYVKARSFNPQTHVDSLIVTPISKASAQQRSGRAGRVRPGKVYRLYTQSAYESLADLSIPEIQRTNIADWTLKLMTLGVRNPVTFDYVSSPHSSLFKRAFEMLYSLGAIDQQGTLIPDVGDNMGSLPLEPRLARMLLTSGSYECTAEICTIVAMLSVDQVFSQPHGRPPKSFEIERAKFSAEEGDHLTYLNVFRSYQRQKKRSDDDATLRWCQRHYLNRRALQRAETIREKIIRYLSRMGVNVRSARSAVMRMDDPTCSKIRQCILTGFFANAARWQADKGYYTTPRDSLELHIHPSSTLFKRAPNWVVFHEVVETKKRYMRDVISINPVWLTEIAPHFFEYARR